MAIGKLKCELGQKKNCGIPIIVHHLLLPSILLVSKLLSYLEGDGGGQRTDGARNSSVDEIAVGEY